MEDVETNAGASSGDKRSFDEVRGSDSSSSSYSQHGSDSRSGSDSEYGDDSDSDYVDEHNESKNSTTPNSGENEETWDDRSEDEDEDEFESEDETDDPHDEDYDSEDDGDKSQDEEDESVPRAAPTAASLEKDKAYKEVMEAMDFRHKKCINKLKRNLGVLSTIAASASPLDDDKAQQAREAAELFTMARNVMAGNEEGKEDGDGDGEMEDVEEEESVHGKGEVVRQRAFSKQAVAAARTVIQAHPGMTQFICKTFIDVSTYNYTNLTRYTPTCAPRLAQFGFFSCLHETYKGATGTDDERIEASAKACAYLLERMLACGMVECTQVVVGLFLDMDKHIDFKKMAVHRHAVRGVGSLMGSSRAKNINSWNKKMKGTTRMVANVHGTQPAVGQKMHPKDTERIRAVFGDQHADNHVSRCFSAERASVDNVCV